MAFKNTFSSVGVIAAFAFALTFTSMPVANGAEVVEFESISHTFPPSPFRAKRAKQLGVTYEGVTEPATALTGFLVKPAGDGPFPAIVLMHGCGGIDG